MTRRCDDHIAGCFRWASEGWCGHGMPASVCPGSCGLCADATDDPCQVVQDAVRPGDIAATFARTMTMEHLRPTRVSADPFVVVFDAFLDAERASELAKLAERTGFRARGSSCGQKSVCNSTSVSCVPVPGGDCWALDEMRRLEQQMLQVVQVPPANCEPLRFFRYFEGETFGLHHDAHGQSMPAHTPGGPRVWTLFVFLSAPEGGGHFEMPELNLSIAPRPGRAVLWPHLLDDDLMTPDERTAHRGAPVTAGAKYGVNLHAHRNNLRERVLGGCELSVNVTTPDKPHAEVARLAHVFDYEATPGR